MGSFSALGWVNRSMNFTRKGEYCWTISLADPLNKRGYTLAELKALDQKTFEEVGL